MPVSLFLLTCPLFRVSFARSLPSLVSRLCAFCPVGKLAAAHVRQGYQVDIFNIKCLKFGLLECGLA